MLPQKKWGDISPRQRRIRPTDASEWRATTRATVTQAVGRPHSSRLASLAQHHNAGYIIGAMGAQSSRSHKSGISRLILM